MVWHGINDVDDGVSKKDSWDVFFILFFFIVDLFLLCVFLSPKLESISTNTHTHIWQQRTHPVSFGNYPETNEQKKTNNPIWWAKHNVAASLRGEIRVFLSVAFLGKMMNQRFKGWINVAFWVHLLFHHLLFQQTQNCCKMVCCFHHLKQNPLFGWYFVNPRIHLTICTIGSTFTT